MSQDEAPEFSRLVNLSHVGDVEHVETITATEAERAALCRRFGLLSLDRLEARVALKRRKGRVRLALTGRLKAELAQACVVSLDPVPARIDQEFSISYGAPEDAREVDVEADPALEGLEPLPAGSVDIGEAVAQELALALDPYPRAPGAQVEAAAPPPAPVKENPFAVLKKSLKPGG